MAQAIAEKLTPAQVRALDAVALHGELVGKTVARKDGPANEVQLVTARKLVELGYLEPSGDNLFVLAKVDEGEDGDEVEPVRPELINGSVTLTGQAARKMAAKLRALLGDEIKPAKAEGYGKLPAKKLNAQQAKTKKRTRNARRVANAQRRINRKNQAK
jgi:hypothetical protein